MDFLSILFNFEDLSNPDWREDETVDEYGDVVKELKEECSTSYSEETGPKDEDAK